MISWVLVFSNAVSQAESQHRSSNEWKNWKAHLQTHLQLQEQQRLPLPCHIHISRWALEEDMDIASMAGNQLKMLVMMMMMGRRDSSSPYRLEQVIDAMSWKYLFSSWAFEEWCNTLHITASALKEDLQEFINFVIRKWISLLIINNNSSNK